MLNHHDFVISTGRCGNRSIGAWLHTCTKDTRIETYADRWSRYGPERLRTGDELPVSARFCLTSFPPGIEVDNTLSLFVLDLLELFPKARFVWLIRNAWDCVSSMMAWKWYRDSVDNFGVADPFSSNRLEAPWVGEFTQTEWLNLSKLGKCAWCWSFVNREIERQLLRVPRLAKMMIRLEDWNDEKAQGLAEFLEIKCPDDLELPRLNHGIWDNERPVWNTDEKALLLRFCGSMMEKHYPGHAEPEEVAA